jgi:two-component system phosphate regulon sensor histidine kinase PhoR
MPDSLDTISKKISALNKTTLDSMVEKDKLAIIKNFTETGIKILKADFGFAWWKFTEEEEYKLVYKSDSTPYNPTIPRDKAGNYIARITKKPFFDSDVKKGEYEFNISDYLKSYIIIPIFYGDNVYGSVVLCYKKKHNFTEEEVSLATALGNTNAQTITVHHLIESEREALTLAKKQKETQVLLEEEKLKTEFIANATHEFRTPLAIMRGNVELVLRDKNKSLASAAKALRVVDKEIIRLSALLSDLALLTNPKKNQKQVIHTIPVNLEYLLKKMAKRLAVLARNKKISIKITNRLGGAKILGDEKYLEKLFINLLRNAIIYGKEKGHIIVDISKSKKNMAVIKVADNGIGMSKQELPHVFDRFFRTDKARMMTNIGTGLGLAISKSVVESHGGTISVKSTEGKGTMFTVELPLAKKMAKKV